LNLADCIIFTPTKQAVVIAVNYSRYLKIGAIKQILILIAFFTLAYTGRAQVIAAPSFDCIATGGGPTDTLSWTPVANNACGPFVCYLIYRSATRNGPYTLYSTVTSQAASQAIINNGVRSPWFYYIRDSFNCPGATYTSSDTLENETNPKPPLLQSVDVQTDGTIKLTWLRSASPQTKGYYIYYYKPNGTLASVFVAGGNTTSWTDVFDNPSIAPQKYSIAATDLCSGNPPSSSVPPQQSVWLQYQGARCDRTIKLNWTKYINYPMGVESYRVLVNKNNTGYVMVEKLDSNAKDYGYTDFNDGDSLQITIVAVSAADTNVVSHSNYVRFVASVVQPPAYVHITNITVNTDNSISTTWITDTRSELLSYQIENSEDSNLFNNVFIKPVFLPTPPSDSYRDSTPEPQYGPYFYRVTAIDSCQGRRISTPAKSITLTGELSDYYEVTLTWNALEIQGATVLKYNLYRDIGGTGSQLVHTFSNNTLLDKDSVYQFINEKGNFCYRIEAVYGISLPDANYSDTLSSWSNIVCVDHRPIIFVPNAFVPNGLNNTFKPKIIFGDPTGYSLQIFNRYGGKIYESNDPNTGWDGYDHGKMSPQGGYAYLIQFIAADGTAIERKGIVLLISK
jgi:gliding motility-associated-like protein